MKPLLKINLSKLRYIQSSLEAKITYNMTFESCFEMWKTPHNVKKVSARSHAHSLLIATILFR
jgi:hypothetical protein